MLETVREGLPEKPPVPSGPEPGPSPECEVPNASPQNLTTPAGQGTQQGRGYGTEGDYPSSGQRAGPLRT